MGGSFSEIGGHNPLEPALFNKPVIVGHNMSNFNEIMQQLRQENAIIELTNSTPTNESSTQLVNEISALLQQPKRQQTLGENALKVVLQNQGASEKTLAQVINLLSTTANITSTTPLGDNS
jgi:3-deoxy-D-manno-octulosonic-acid transferase